MRNILTRFVAVVIVLLLYCYPVLRAGREIGRLPVPPMFAADLPMYINLSNGSLASKGADFLNPYYLVSTPYNGSGYLKFRLAALSFSTFRTLFKGDLWSAMLVWNLCWWATLAICVLCLFDRFLPMHSEPIVFLGLTLVMLFNFGVFKNLVAALMHLPSTSAFTSLELPFMRAFVPVIPITILVAYLALQIEALRRRDVAIIWIGMGILQLAALEIFPYATLMMAGVTAVSLAGDFLFEKNHTSWLTATIYGTACGIADCLFALRGSVGFYSGQNSLFSFQPGLLRHLIGGNWVLLAAIVLAVALQKNIPPMIKWPLVGLGVTNLILLLGDAVVPAKAILLSHHAGHFIHATIAILLTFLAAAVIRAYPSQRLITNVIAISATGFLLVTGGLLSLGTYRGFYPANVDEAEFSRVMATIEGNANELIVARSQSVDDPCGWGFEFTRDPVLYCTDAEIMLTPEQNLEIQRLRQSIYLFLTGRDSRSLRSALAGPSRLGLMYELGYWAEATSLSRSEQEDGVKDINKDLIRRLEQVEQGNPWVSSFFKGFRKIVVVDRVKNPIFPEDRLGRWLNFNGAYQIGNLKVSNYTSK